MRLRTTLLVAILPLCAATSALAQLPGSARGSRPGWSLGRTMREFTRDLDSFALGYFPARGEWDYVIRKRYPDGTARIGIHRIPAAQTEAAIARPDGPFCNAFHVGDGAVMGTLAWYAMMDERGWRRVSPTRFEPRDPEPGWNVFVEWRREDGRWVVSATGQEGEHVPRLLGVSVEEARDTMRGRRLRLPMPASARYATATSWHQAGEPLHLGGPPMLKHRDPPRKWEEGTLAYYTTHDGVTVWAEPRELRSSWGPSVVYVPLDPSGVFQAYYTWRGNGCN